MCILGGSWGGPLGGGVLGTYHYHRRRSSLFGGYDGVEGILDIAGYPGGIFYVSCFLAGFSCLLKAGQFSCGHNLAWVPKRGTSGNPLEDPLRITPPPGNHWGPPTPEGMVDPWRSPGRCRGDPLGESLSLPEKGSPRKYPSRVPRVPPPGLPRGHPGDPPGTPPREPPGELPEDLPGDPPGESAVRLGDRK